LYVVVYTIYTGRTTDLESLKRTHRKSPHFASRQRRSSCKSSVQDSRHTISRTPRHHLLTRREAHKEQQCGLFKASCALPHHRQGTEQEANVVACGEESETVSIVIWRAVSVCQYHHCGCHLYVCMYVMSACTTSASFPHLRVDHVAVSWLSKCKCALI